MTGTNHALTGALIAAALPYPIIFVPIAIASHFGEIIINRKRLSRAVWLVDALLLAGLLGLFIATSQPLAILIGALCAMSPDAAWIYRFTVSEHFGKLPPAPENVANRLHSSIQKYESRKGLIIEVGWLIVIANLLRLKL